MSKKIITLILLTGLTFVSCKKEEQKTEKVEFRNDIAKFAKFEELMEEIRKTREMTLDELTSYEESKGYLSFGRHTDMIYNSINFEELKTEDEYYDLVEKNSDYIEIIEKDGEKYIETKMATNPFRYIVNNKNMFELGVRVYKVFEDGFVSTNVSNKSKLEKYNPKDLTTEKSNDLFLISLFGIADLSKDNANNCGMSISASQTNGSERTNIAASLVFFDGEDYFVGRFTQLISDSYVRPYKKTLGIWYYCNRTISFNIKLGVDKLNVTWGRNFYESYEPGSHGSVKWFSTGETISTGAWWRPLVHYGGSNSWGDTPSTDHVYMTCNTHIF